MDKGTVAIFSIRTKNKKKRDRYLGTNALDLDNFDQQKKDAGIRTEKHADATVRLDDRIVIVTFDAHHFLSAFQDTEVAFEGYSVNLATVACSIYPIQRVSLIVLCDY